jgi:hypothetical protein
MNAIRTHFLGMISASFLMITFVGCGSSGPEIVPVTGTVTKNNKPMNNVRIEFWPEATTGIKSTAVTDAEGRYELKTDDGKAKGAIVGTHRVLLKDLDLYGDKFLGRAAENIADLSGGKKPRFSAKLGEGASEAIKKTVTEGPPNTIDIEVP